ncbi:unnamed protein product [Bursaphelenchus okinawaensis]|uniref:Cytochrome P450 n=1 Tax=Bursaphelenchus okinawaensis TaxID=465554 RepID=A0A811LSR9_9BILA|nr:unnamed protein product [Bursaphelenchus okinawaensis]CAG9128437.1 unnamed protein product [Bursaphelenchus okinawaensis]
MIIQIILAIIVLGIVRWIWDRIKYFKLRSELGLGGPEISFPLGNLKFLLDYPKYAKNFIKEGYVPPPEPYGETFGVYVGSIFEINTTDLDIVNEVFIKQFSKFVNRPTQHFNAGYPLNDSILQMTKDGVEGRGYGWKDVRSVVSPIFTTGKLKAMLPLMEERTEAFINMLKTKASQGEIEMYIELQSLSLDIIGRCAFGMETDCINDKNDKFYTNTRTFFQQLSLEDSFGTLVGMLSPKLSHFIRPWTKEGRAEKVLIHGLKEIVDKRRQNFENESGNGHRRDLISLLLEQDRERQMNQKKPPLHEMTLISNCYAILLAGYETTSTALAFALYALSKHQDVQQQLFDEINDYIESEKKVKYEDIFKFQYLDAVVKETLRRYSPVVFFSSRECVEDCEIKGIKFKKGICIQAPVQSFHQNPEWWPEPFKFDPNRFLNIQKIDQLKWIPFGIGPRNCVGMRFAELEMKSALIAIVKNFKITPGQEILDKDLDCTVSSVLYRPASTLPLKLEVR